MIKIPYGVSNFKMLVENGYIYIDRTTYVEQLENLDERYLFFVRPRRFGKSLFLSVLEHYYGLQYKDQFDKLFGQYYIGQNPTPAANQYLILKFDFSQIDTSSFDNTYDSFLQNAKIGVKEFFTAYPQYFDAKNTEALDELTYPAHIIQDVFLAVKQNAPNHKVYLLIDEYDHFANEILSFRFDEFNEMVGQNGFVRKFYEAIKVGTHSGVVDRLFVTGVSPITLDSLTSGFNISTNLTLYQEFHDMMGFTKQEVKGILEQIGVTQEEMIDLLVLMKNWYDGYLFSKKVKTPLYNSDMVLYFANQYAREKEFPEELLDPNIATDYTKIRRIFKIKDQESLHLEYLEELLKNGLIKSKLVRQFEISKFFEREDFISLLYYMGIITIQGVELTNFTFRMPNYVIQELYYQYFHQIIVERSQLKLHGVNKDEKVHTLALDNDIQPLIQYVESILTELSTRDKMKFDEKYLKIFLTSIFFNTSVYIIRNEVEVKKSATEKGYVDILLVKRPPFQTNYQFAIELKYLKKKEAKTAPKIKKEAIVQLKSYLQNDPYLQSLKALKAYVIMFVGNKGEAIQIEV